MAVAKSSSTITPLAGHVTADTVHPDPLYHMEIGLSASREGVDNHQ